MAKLKNKRRHIVVGNWKLHGDSTFVGGLLGSIVSRWVGVHKAEVVLCPSFVHLSQAYNEYLAHSNIALGGQNISLFEEGAYTGDVSAEMLHDVGCQYVIIGHSERRQHHNETDGQIARKFQLALDARLVPILCLGENLVERESGRIFDVIERQLKAVLDYCGIEGLVRGVIAYEPVWALGLGRTVSPAQAQEVHRYIREYLGQNGALVRIIYGGSVKPGNALDLFEQPDIDGVLVGGASLDAQDFIEICQSAEY